MKIILAILFMTLNIALASELSVKEIASRALEKNIIKTSKGEFLVAGANQFKSLWTRDFCFSTPGLLEIGKKDLVKNQLNFLIENRRKDGLVPIYADSISPMLRVAIGSINKALGTKIKLPFNSKFIPYYNAMGSYPTIDANLLVLKAAYDYYKYTNDFQWWIAHQSDFRDIFSYYENFKQDGLIVQGAFSDWQDSVKRKGKTFFTNLLYLDVSKSFGFLNKNEVEDLSSLIHENFYDKETGLYFTIKGSPQISLDGILWAIDKNLMPDTQTLYQNLKLHPLWNKNAIPGFVTFPSYPNSWIASHNKISGLREYHGSITWSWLIAYSAIIAKKQNDLDEFHRISQSLQKLISRDQTITEIYQSRNEFPAFETKLYRSESPFSWGAAFSIKMLNVDSN